MAVMKEREMRVKGFHHLFFLQNWFWFVRAVFVGKMKAVFFGFRVSELLFLCKVVTLASDLEFGNTVSMSFSIEFSSSFYRFNDLMVYFRSNTKTNLNMATIVSSQHGDRWEGFVTSILTWAITWRPWTRNFKNFPSHGIVSYCLTAGTVALAIWSLATLFRFNFYRILRFLKICWCIFDQIDKS